MPPNNVLIYILRRDLRQSDNPIFHTLATSPDHGFTHLLPVYIFPAEQIEVSGFLAPPKDAASPAPKSPYPEARSKIGGFWRCGPHRAKFLVESVWDLKSSLEEAGSGLCVRVGMMRDVVSSLVEGFQGRTDDDRKPRERLHVGAVWMTSEEAVEEKEEEKQVLEVCERLGVEFKLWRDEKYFVDDRDLPFSDPQELPDIYTTFRKTLEPLRNVPRPVLEAPMPGSLPSYPDSSLIPPQHYPFTIPDAYADLESCLLAPLNSPDRPLIRDPPAFPRDAATAHPFRGGESQALSRLDQLIKSGSMSTYKDTRNGLLGIDCSTKLSGWLSIGCITARQVHTAMLAFEDGSNEAYQEVEGYGKGENEGTQAVRFELLWRDYMMLCTRKFGSKLFSLYGFKGAEDVGVKEWLRPSRAAGGRGKTQAEITEIFSRFLNGTTGMGLIDASQRELYLTGYTSNRARQNVASFLSKHLGFDWRLGAEWYECMLIDSDVGANWGNWQYVSGVGSDPRREGRVFNPVKQAFDYDPNGEYVRTWVEELQGIQIDENDQTPGSGKGSVMELFQAWTMKEERKKELGLENLKMVREPLMKIEFTVGRKEKPATGEARPGRAPGSRGSASGNARAHRGRAAPPAVVGHGHHHYPRPPPRNFNPPPLFRPYPIPPPPMHAYPPPHPHAAYGYGYSYGYHNNAAYGYGNPRPYYRRRGGGGGDYGGPSGTCSCGGSGGRDARPRTMDKISTESIQPHHHPQHLHQHTGAPIAVSSSTV